MSSAFRPQESWSRRLYSTLPMSGLLNSPLFAAHFCRASPNKAPASTATRLFESQPGGCGDGSRRRECQRKRHRGPTCARSGNPLVVSVWKSAVEVRLESQRAGLHIRRAVFLLAIQQELNTASVCGSGGG